MFTKIQLKSVEKPSQYLRKFGANQKKFESPFPSLGRFLLGQKQIINKQSQNRATIRNFFSNFPYPSFDRAPVCNASFYRNRVSLRIAPIVHPPRLLRRNQQQATKSKFNSNFSTAANFTTNRFLSATPQKRLASSSSASMGVSFMFEICNAYKYYFPYRLSNKCTHISRSKNRKTSSRRTFSLSKASGQRGARDSRPQELCASGI